MSMKLHTAMKEKNVEEWQKEHNPHKPEIQFPGKASFIIIIIMTLGCLQFTQLKDSQYLMHTQPCW